MDEQELNKKLAEWAGFERKRVTDEFVESWVKYVWYYPKSSGRFDVELPDFPESLGVCFRWLVPKLQGMGLNIHIHLVVGRRVKVVISDVASTHLTTAETPALALCLAIEKLIDEENKVLK